MSLLGQPFEINGMRLRNRIVMLPMVTNLSTADGFVTDGLVAHYAERSRGRAGMVIVESTAVNPNFRNCVQGVGAWSDAFVPGLQRLAQGIKAGGAAAALQIFHAGAKTHSGQPPVSCSGMALRAGERPRVIESEELPGVVADFAQAARRVAEAGFDAVEIHAAHFYLLSEFLSPFTNKRTDGYGGDVLGRARLALEVLAAVRREVGAGYPVLVRMHGRERIAGGMSDEDVRETARLLADAGADGFDVSTCNQSSFTPDDQGGFWSLRPYLAREEPAGTTAEQTAAVRSASGRPTIAVGKLAQPQVAEQILAEGSADLIGIGRNYLADPNLAIKMLEGRGDEILTCKQCFLCLNTTTGKQKTIRCAVNPQVGGVVD